MSSHFPELGRWVLSCPAMKPLSASGNLEVLLDPRRFAERDHVSDLVLSCLQERPQRAVSYSHLLYEQLSQQTSLTAQKTSQSKGIPCSEFVLPNLKHSI